MGVDKLWALCFTLALTRGVVGGGLRGAEPSSYNYERFWGLYLLPPSFNGLTCIDWLDRHIIVI